MFEVNFLAKKNWIFVFFNFKITSTKKYKLHDFSSSNTMAIFVEEENEKESLSSSFPFSLIFYKVNKKETQLRYFLKLFPPLKK
jgi:hypothetical protein